MIVRYIKQGYEIIFQRNHALLAGELASQLKMAFRPPQWTETLSAILEHDDGQTDWSDADWVDAKGHPIDFSERGFDLEQAKRVTSEAAYKSTWVHLLVSMHASSLCSESKYQTKEMSQFIADQKELQRQLRKRLSLRKSEIDRYYRFLRWCDECSLILCKGEIEKTPKKPQMIGEIASRTPVKINCSKDGFMTVAPWCFQEDLFSVSAELYRLKQPAFASTAQLRDEISHTKPITKTWTFKKETAL